MEDLLFQFLNQRYSPPQNEGDFVPKCQSMPIRSMYGIFTCVWLMFMANVGKYNNIAYMDPIGYGMKIDKGTVTYSDYIIIFIFSRKDLSSSYSSSRWLYTGSIDPGFVGEMD